jgi:prepilin-type N-terminal cleavage/methylation domain-containing protein
VRKHNTHAFTLVELIVVITILAILGTLAFMSFKNYTQSARNSSRISDMKTLEKAMSLLGTIGASYPSPDEAENITYSGGLAWKQ